ncbi:MAG: hypothetical protein AB8E15_03305 [Bdellovibrionales bacterium]
MRYFVAILFVFGVPKLYSDAVNTLMQGGSLTLTYFAVADAVTSADNVPRCTGGQMQSCVIAGMAALGAVSMFAKSDETGSVANEFDPCSGAMAQLCNAGGPGSYTNPGQGNPYWDDDNPGYDPGGGDLPEDGSSNVYDPSASSGASGSTDGFSDAYNRQEAARKTAAALRLKYEKVAKDTLKTLEENGYYYDNNSKSMVTPSGAKIPSSALSSPSSMKANGFSDSDIQALQDSVKKGKATAKALVAGSMKMAMLGGGSRSKRRMGKSATSQQFDPMADFLKQMNAKKKKKARGVANNQPALKRKVSNGESIGVASDNIFHMISRRYHRKTQENSFQP